jgi:cytochrome c-type biogenesis protein CcmH/NrfG
MSKRLAPAALAIAALFIAPSAIASDGPDPLASDVPNASVDAAYDQLQSGELERAVARLEMLRAENPDDPAILINLGSAYSKMGELEKAADAYRAAVDSDVRYRLELADGEWVDSRLAARRALALLEAQAVAMR